MSHSIKIALVFGALILFIGINKRASAQQDAQLSQYMFNTLAFNPAYAGSAELFSVSALYRAQWVNFEGAPRTQILTGNSPLRNKKLAVGGSIYNDAIGYSQTFGVYGDFAYRILFQKTQLSFGAKAGFDIFQSEYTKLNTTDPGDPKFEQDVKGKFLPNVGFGVYYYSDKYYVGLSSPKLVTSSYTKTDNGAASKNKQERTVYLTGGYVFHLSEFVVFKPAVLFKFVSRSPAQIDLNVNFLFVERFWIGIMYRPGAAWGGMMQFLITEKLRFGYSLDFATTDLQRYNSGTHEFMLSYDFNNFKKRITSPRYF